MDPQIRVGLDGYGVVSSICFETSGQGTFSNFFLPPQKLILDTDQDFIGKRAVNPWQVVPVF